MPKPEDTRSNVENEDMKMLRPMGSSNDAISEALRKKREQEALDRAVDNRDWYEKTFGTNRPYYKKD